MLFFKSGNLIVYPERFVAESCNKLLYDLTKREFMILLYFGRRAGKSVTREELHRMLPKDGKKVVNRTSKGLRRIDVYIRRLRKRTGWNVATVRNIGYKVERGYVNLTTIERALHAQEKVLREKGLEL